MKKRLSKLLSTVLVLSCVTSAMLTPASATEGINLYYTGLTSFSVDIDILTNGLSTPNGWANVRNGYTVDATLSLQRSSNGYSWSSLKEWSGSGTERVVFDKEYFVVPGYDYRAKISVKVYNSSGTLVDNATEYSGTISY